VLNWNLRNWELFCCGFVQSADSILTKEWFFMVSKILKEKGERIQRLRDEGKTYREIGRIVGVSPASAWRVLSGEIPMESYPKDPNKRRGPFPVYLRRYMEDSK